MKLLIVEDDLRQRHLLLEVFSEQGYDVTACHNGQEALLTLGSDSFDTVITDLKMPHISGTDVLKASHQQDREVPVIIITGYGTVDTAIEAMKIGAYDYIQKPFDPEELLLLVNKAVQHFGLIKKNREMSAAIVTLQDKEFIGSSPAMHSVKSLIERVAPLDVSVLIQGETGTGKELAARLIHRASKRSDRQFLALNCGALNQDLLESELFGHEKSAFTGATREKKGLFEASSEGTIFLDEINSMSPALQVKLLRILQENTFMRVGGTTELKVNLRIISASNADLKQEVEQGKFREDLYYRLNVMNIVLPPLRERLDDIPELAYFFLKRYAAKYSKDVTSIAHETMALLAKHSWPGNVRELENCISRSMIMEHGNTLQPGSLNLEMDGSGKSPHSEGVPLMPLEEMEKFMVSKALRQTAGNKGQAAQLLGIDASTLWRKMKRWNLV